MHLQAVKLELQQLVPVLKPLVQQQLELGEVSQEPPVLAQVVELQVQQVQQVQLPHHLMNQ
jgi:hypothetical protein